MYLSDRSHGSIFREVVMPAINRRDLITTGASAISALAMFQSRFAYAFPSQVGEVVIPWLDQPAANPVPQVIKSQLVWEKLDSWITPNDSFFSIAHFDRPTIDASAWKLEIEGLVKTPLSLSLADIQQRPRKEVTFTIECSGNHGLPFFNGGIGNALWAGTPLASVLEEAGVKDSGIEVVFWGTDAGDVEIKDSSHDIKMHQNFARSMSLADAMNPGNLLCYEMNGAALPADNGAPLRLIAPGWYGVANVKWLKRIEVRDKRFMNLFMGRNYVTIREETHDGETVWTETSVGRALLKSAPAKVTRADKGYRVIGAAWGAPIAKVEVKIDDGPWIEATIDRSDDADFAWKIWSVAWENASSGEHAITSRATDTSGKVQPAMDDPVIAKKHTYWESNGQVTRRVNIVP
jgi:DMSO/TMAO reductase YedYZ molybdopterin-dependent catalytic subunit